MLTTLKCGENPIQHLVETPGKVGGQKPQHEISVLLEQRVFTPVAPVGIGITQMLSPIQFDNYSKFRAKGIHFH